MWSNRMLKDLVISIHALREEGDVFAMFPAMLSPVFLSTPSARRATLYLVPFLASASFLSTPSARRATASVVLLRELLYLISIHALREEGDCTLAPLLRRCRYFYPRPPRGGRLCDFYFSEDWYRISIHALREEGDLTWQITESTT